jgi:hypothetical protein
MIVLLEEDRGLTLRRVGLRERVKARLRSGSLDEALVRGASPESSAELALHARQVASPAGRQLLAQGLRRVVALADAPDTGRRAVPIASSAVRRARNQLEALAARLASEGPVDARGVARIRVLLSDGSGPLYRPSAPGRLRGELVAARSALDPDW